MDAMGKILMNQNLIEKKQLKSREVHAWGKISLKKDGNEGEKWTLNKK